jgi:hypothetical protein
MPDGRLALVLVTTFAMGCATLRDQAETAYARGNYRQAADLYDKLVTEHPNDVAAKSRRTDARNAVLRQQLFLEQTTRAAGHDAMATVQLGELLDQRDKWKMATEELSVATLATEVAAIGVYVEGDVLKRMRNIGPLGGEQLLLHYTPLLAHRDFGNRRDGIRAQLAVTGRAACMSLASDASAESPYWSWIVARYCVHWGDSPVAAQTFPNLRIGLVVDGAIKGQTDAEVASLHTDLTAAFRRSVWWAPTGVGVAHATIDGEIKTSFSSQPLSLSADWEEEVPYTDYETHSESYQEPYDDTESYTEEVPYSDSELKAEPCGDTTCTTTIWVTKYRTEWKTRTVTKQRTAWRDVQVAVTKYRTVPHVFQYNVIERSGRYISELRAHIDRELPDVVAAIDSDSTETGIDNEVTFEPANVYPGSANLRTTKAFATAERARLQEQMIKLLDDRYSKLYCAATKYTREEAAACAYVDAKRAPSGVHAALAVAFGTDEPFLAAVLRR